METITLVGPSGSGKSHRALLLAHYHDVDIIIDDGLVIKGSQILTGISAKKQPTRIGAIKTALFTSPEHAMQVKEVLEKEKPQKILILGTSIEMVDKIAQRLDLNGPTKRIFISEIATEDEIKAAKMNRKKHGTHVIPAPTLAVKPKFSGILIKPIKLFLNKKTDNLNLLMNNPIYMEQTVVRPTYSYLGKFYIANSVLLDIIRHCFRISNLPVKLLKIDLQTFSEGIVINADISIKYGRYFIPSIAKKVQMEVLHHVELMTAINVLSININIKKLYID